MVELLKTYARPGSPLALVLLLAVGVAWLYMRPSTGGARRLFLAMLLGYWAVTTPLGAALLVTGLSYGLTPVERADAAAGADTIVVLGGGSKTFTVGGPVVGQLTSQSALRAPQAARGFKLS